MHHEHTNINSIEFSNTSAISEGSRANFLERTLMECAVPMSMGVGASISIIENI